MASLAHTLTFGTLGTTDQTIILQSPPGQMASEIKSLSIHNTSETADCWVKVFWNGVQDGYVALGPLERTEAYAGGESLGPGEVLSLQAEIASVINYTLKGAN